MKPKFYITTPIYYASGLPHIGHAYTTILADVICRYKKLIGYECFFQTGMDEHGQKIQDLAIATQLSPKEFVDRNVLPFIKLWQDLDIQYDSFTRTTNPDHMQAVQKTFSLLLNNKNIYLDEWNGLYCVHCEENYVKTQAIEKNHELYCAVGHKLTIKKERTYFLQVSKFSKWIKEYYKTHPDFIFPQIRVNELINNFIDNESGLYDLSISRTTFDWGVHLLEDNRHVAYVWIDALLTYITGLGYLQENDDNFKKYWHDENTQIIHLMSKEITRFHCIYWPILLEMLKLRQPTKIISHGWIVTKEGKMSKSLGNVINPRDYINEYGSDSLRYYLMKEIRIEDDGIFNQELFVNVYNNDLANNFGNLVSRTIGMINKHNAGVIPAALANLSELDIQMKNKILTTTRIVHEGIENCKIHKIIQAVYELELFANKYVEISKPWELIKNNKHEQALNMLFYLSNAVRAIIVLLSPILVKGSAEAIKQLNFNDKIIIFDSLNDLDLIAGTKVSKSTPIFIRK